MTRTNIWLLAVLLVVFSGCYYDKESVLYPQPPCTAPATNNYATVVEPLMTQYCTSCHSGQSPSGGIALDTYAAVKPYVDNGKLYNSIIWANGTSPMPKNGSKLTSCKISHLKAWIDAGAPQ